VEVILGGNEEVRNIYEVEEDRGCEAEGRNGIEDCGERWVS
jgi:hypothetical protein